MASRSEKPVRPGTLGALIRAARGDMTQRELAEAVTGDGAQFGKVNMWEHNKRLPAPEFIPALIDVLDLDEPDFWIAYGRTMVLGVGDAARRGALGLAVSDDAAIADVIDQETSDEPDPGNDEPPAPAPPPSPGKPRRARRPPRA